MTRMQGHGIVVDLAPGWDAQIYQRAPEPVGPIGQALGAPPETPMPILHLANFALPTGRGDYGGGAVETMRSGGVFISVLQHDPAEVTSPLFAGRRTPWPLSATHFDPNSLQRRLSHHAGHQSFFAAAGRPYCLYVVLSRFALRGMLVGVVNQALAGVSFV